MSVPSRFIKAGGYLMRVPSVDVAEVGSGAGSIAALDAAGLMTVGPQSAGADPGPVCYGLGGKRPTVTDANAVLGYLPPVLAGGTLKLDLAAARAAIDAVLARPLGLSVEAAAHGIREVANATMMRAIRAVTVERGLDPRELTLLAFGGSGPVHACALAQTLGIARVLFPPSPGVFTAVGMLAGVVGHHDLRPAPGALEELDAGFVEGLAAEMRASGARALAAEGYPAGRIAFGFSIDLRLRGQEACLSVPFERFDAAALRAAFVAEYRDLYGYAPGDAVEAVLVRLHAQASLAAPLDFGGVRPPARSASAEGKACDACISTAGRRWRRRSWRGRRCEEARAGPLIIEAADTTIVVPPGAVVTPDATGSLVAEMGA